LYSPPDPPIAPRIPKAITQHGHTRVDNYFWLRGRDNPETIRYLEAENAYAEAVLKPVEGLREQLYQEILGRIQQTDLSVPVRKGNYYYYTRTEEGKQYPVHCRKHGSLEAAEETLLDLNEIAKTEKYVRLGNFAVSPDHRLLAYGLETSGDETYTIVVKDLAAGTLLPDRIDNTYYGLEWTNDSRSLLYVTLDAAKRPYQCWRRRLGAAPATDELLYEEPDERFHLTLSKSRSEAFFFLNLDSAASSEVRYLEASGASVGMGVVAGRRYDIQYDVTHHGDLFFIRIADTGRNFRVVTAPVANPAPDEWREWIAHRQDVTVEAVDAFEHHLVVLEREDGIRRLDVHNLKDQSRHTVTFPEKVYTVVPGDNPEFHTNVLRFHYTSLVTPMSVFDYDMDTRERVLRKQTPVLGGFDPANYESVRVHATAEDGVRVPVSMVYRKGIRRDGSNPMLLYGYGSYGISIDPVFSSDRLSLIDRGFVYAIAHIRGGGELGKPWHDAGKLKLKRNTFEDFINAAEYLIAEGYTSPDRLAIMGGSAGGLLVGAVINQRPELFRAVVAKVPFVDVLNTATDPALPLTVIEYDEWGDSNQEDYWDYIRSYSPYDNIERQDYPHMLVTAGLNDPRVSYWEPAKWVAKLRTMKTDSNLLLLKTDMTSGHGGPSGRYDRIRETALDYAFLLSVMPGSVQP
jgi:oligopeptidase B